MVALFSLNGHFSSHDEEHHPPKYPGSGTPSDPYIVEFNHNDPRNPLNFTLSTKVLITFLVTLSVFAVTLTSSAYSGSADDILRYFHTKDEIFALGISLFVLGFAIGPALWAPLSELYGRRILFIGTHAAMVAVVAGTAGCKSITALMILRLLGGTFGASPLTNSGGVIADLYPPFQRGVAMALFSAAPFLGPALGPTIGGFVSMNVGWRWVQGVCCIFVGLVWIVGSLLVPETYAPVILQKMASDLSKSTGKVYVSVIEQQRGVVKPRAAFAKTLKRPWILLFREPIVLIAATYLAIIYGTIYMLLAAFPIVYQIDRGWDEGIGGLSFLGLTVGMLVGLAYTVYDNKRYQALGAAATPESRIPPGVVGAIAMPIGMITFAWTNSPNIHWSASIILVGIFGFGSVPIFLACLNYLMDSYTIYAASVMAAAAMLRAFFGFAFPLFTTQMYDNLGVHWASSIPAFLTLACVPFPILIYKYGAGLRVKCKYAQESAMLMERLQGEADSGDSTS